MSADRLVHIPGLGDFQLDKILAAQEPLKMAGGRKDEEMFEPRELDIATNERQELDIENIPGKLRAPGRAGSRHKVNIFQTEWRESRPGRLRRK